jgi:hypothetical protein
MRVLRLAIGLWAQVRESTALPAARHKRIAAWRVHRFCLTAESGTAVAAPFPVVRPSPC